MAGEYFTEILHQLIGFPSSRQCRNLKKKFREKYGISDNILDGSLESMSQLFCLFWKSQDKRCIVAVDAALINAHFLIKKNDEVKGLLEDIKIESDLVDLYSTNTDEFYSFYIQHHNEIVKYFFVYYVCSLINQNRSFPILIRKKTCGSANDKVTADLEENVFKICDLGIDVIGVSFDVDQSYLKYVDNVCLDIQNLDKLNLHSPLSLLFEDFDGILAYEDM